MAGVEMRVYYITKARYSKSIARLVLVLSSGERVKCVWKALAKFMIT